MKILLTLPRPLFPADTGGKIRTLNIFQRLAKRAEIHAISPACVDREAEAITQMRRVFHHYVPVPWQETTKFSPKFYMEFLRSRFEPLPYFLAKYNRWEFRQAVERLATLERFDLVVCDFLQSAVALRASVVRPRVLFEHNVEYMIRRRHWEQEPSPLRKWLLDAEWRKARRAEREVCRAFDHVITVSEEDAQQIHREFGVQYVSTLPTGVDTDYFQPRGCQPQKGRLVFVGSMDWHPNEEAISWFVREIFPLIRGQVPEAALTVVGRNPSQHLRNLAGKQGGVTITGTVPDVRPYLAAAEVVVVPLRIGGGTRIKIFEAMAMGCPVVSTTLGAEGLPVQSGQEILLADEPAAFARSVLELLENPDLGNMLAQAAREKIVRHHTWGVTAQAMEEILAGVVARSRNAGEASAMQDAARSILAR